MASNEAASGPSLFSKPHPSQAKKNRTERTYIMPSGFGWAFGGMALVLFFMAAGYANNLIFIFFFMLISVALTGMMLTNRNAKFIRFVGYKVEALFAHEQGAIQIQLENSTAIDSWDLEIFFNQKTPDFVSFALRGQEELVVPVPFMGPHRGYVHLPRLTVQSYFPFGLFRAWRIFKLHEASVVVYPARVGDKNFPQSLLAGAQIHQSGMFRDHRIYQSGDSVRRIDWKASARRREVLVKNFEEPEKPTLHFNWDQTEHLSDIEQRLSQLTVWIDEAEKKNFIYSLQLGSGKWGPSKGKEHWHRCLEKLALYKES